MAIIKILHELPPITGPTVMAEGDHRKECCRVIANLEYYLYDFVNGLTCYRCKRCGCRHFEGNSAPGSYGIK